jgi:hypothetical protein
MPEWEHNFLSWSFGLALVGVIFQYIAGVLFIVEARWVSALAEQFPGKNSILNECGTTSKQKK